MPIPVRGIFDLRENIYDSGKRNYCRVDHGKMLAT